MTVLSPEERLWLLLRGALGTRALALAADLGIADALAEGPRSAADLGDELGADADALRRLLRVLAGEGIFAEEEPGVFRNTEASDLLRGGWGSFAHLFGGAWLRATGGLEASGRAAFPDVFGADFWSWLADNPGERAALDRAMEEGNERRVERPVAI